MAAMGHFLPFNFSIAQWQLLAESGCSGQEKLTGLNGCFRPGAEQIDQFKPLPIGFFCHTVYSWAYNGHKEANPCPFSMN
jgi:hypothetical protein